MLFGVASWVVTILGLNIRTYLTEENFENDVIAFSSAWILYGFHGIISQRILS